MLRDPEEARDNVQDVFCKFLDGNDRTTLCGCIGAVAVMKTLQESTKAQKK